MENTLTEHNLHDKPHLIYNIDETGVTTEHKLTRVIAEASSKPQSVVSPRSATTTIIACGNAMGTALPPFFVFKGKIALPPFFVFKGKKMFDELLANKTPGTTAVMSDLGWSNSIIFKDYLEKHFMKYAQKPQESSQKMLILYDGHTFHVCKPVIDWARANYIVLFTLPPHCGHILQPQNIGFFSPLKSKFNRECQIFLRSNPVRQIIRYDICGLACKAYEKGLSPSNLVAAFRRAGIVPFDRSKISPQQHAPSTILIEHDDTELQSLSVENNKENNRPVSEDENIETLQLPDVEPEISTQPETPKYIAEPKLIHKTAKSFLDSKIPVKQKTE